MRKLATALLVVLVVSAGCLDTASVLSDGTDRTTTRMDPPTIKLVVEDTYDGPFSVKVVNASTSAVFFEKNYTDSESGIIDLSKEIPRNGVVEARLYTNGSLAWNETIRWYEGYRLELRTNGTVSASKVEV